ncbi:MAG: DUF4375 domain-containing protein [Planctomycetales bacterium]
MDSRDATWEMKSELQDKIIAINDRIWGDWHTTSDDEAYAPFSHPEKVFSMIFYLDMEVENGGFYQWIMNSTGMYVRETRDALLEIGAPRVAALVEEAMRMFPGGCPARDKGERFHQLMALDRTAGDKLDELSFPYADERYDLFLTLLKYWDEHGTKAGPAA